MNNKQYQSNQQHNAFIHYEEVYNSNKWPPVARGPLGPPLRRSCGSICHWVDFFIYKCCLQNALKLQEIHVSMPCYDDIVHVYECARGLPFRGEWMGAKSN